MKRCDRCMGSGYLTLGAFGGCDQCPDCNGSGWVDDKLEGPAPAPRRITWRCSCGAVHVAAHFGMKCPNCGAVLPSSGSEARALGFNAPDFKPGDIHERENGDIYRLNDRRDWERVDEKPAAPAPALAKVPIKVNPKGKNRKR